MSTNQYDHESYEPGENSNLGWELRSLGSLGTWQGGMTPSMSNPRYWEGGTIPWVSSGDMKVPRLFSTSQFITPTAVKESSTTFLREKAILVVTRSGILRRYLPIAINEVPLAINQDIKALTVNKEISPEYVLYALQASSSRILTECLKSGTTVESIEVPWLKEFEVGMPTERSEQEAIAEALGEVDALLDALDRLIAKKRDLKQATMQALLTGRTRLPGYTGEWKMVNFGKDSNLKARIGWQGLTTAEYLLSGDYYLITGTDFDSGGINWGSCAFVDKERWRQDKNIQVREHDVLITKDGTIGKVGFVRTLPGPATLNSGVFVARPKTGKEFDPHFLYYILKSRVFTAFLDRLQAGSTINHLYQKDFVDFEFNAPSLPEQRAIAEILSTMDTEIESLMALRSRWAATKQGMMQELLTGRIRLVSPSVPDSAS